MNCDATHRWAWPLISHCYHCVGMAAPPAVTPSPRKAPVVPTPPPRDRKVQKDGKISYADFVWFLLSEEDKKTPTRWA